MSTLTWYEPAAFIRAKTAALDLAPRRWRAFVSMLLIAGALLALFALALGVGYLLNGRFPPVGWWVWPTIAFGVGFLGAYVIPFLGSRATAEININERGIHRKSIVADMVRVETLPWPTILVCRVELVEFSGQMFPALVLHVEGREICSIGLDGRVTTADLEEVLGAYGKKLAVPE